MKNAGGGVGSREKNASRPFGHMRAFPRRYALHGGRGSAAAVERLGAVKGV